MLNFNVPLKDAHIIESLPANSNWLTFFKTNFFGKNYCNFSGRASRREYWISNILWGILSFIVEILVFILIEITKLNFSYILLILSLYQILPLWALSSRRFHDINMRAWWTLAIIPLFFTPFFKGDKKDNRFGKNIYQ